MKKADFIWTVGYGGNTAVVNKKAKASYRDIGPRSLLEKGLLRPAFCSALWEMEIEKKASAMDEFISELKQRTGMNMTLPELKRMLGVYQIPDPAIKVMMV